MQGTTGVRRAPAVFRRGAPALVAGASALLLGALLVSAVAPSEAAGMVRTPAVTQAAAPSHPVTSPATRRPTEAAAAALLPLPLPLPTLLPLPRLPLPLPLPLPTLLPPLPPLPPVPTLLPTLPPVLPTLLPTARPSLPPGLPLPSGAPGPGHGARTPPSGGPAAPASPLPSSAIPGASGGRQATGGPSGDPSADARRGHAARAEEARILAEAPLPERLQVMGQNAVRNSGLPLGAFLLLGLFLLIQDRVDRRDPKLALAPEYPEPHLLFGPPPDDPAPGADRPDEPTETPR